MKTNKKMLAKGFALLLAAASQTTNATIITDNFGNNNFASATNLDSLFSTDANLDVYDSTNTPWVSINRIGTQDNDMNDYFSFSANAGDTAHFDFDMGAGFFSVLYDGSLTPLAINAPFGGFGFEINSLDPMLVDNLPFFSPDLLSFTFASTGMYIFGVENQMQGSGYSLNVSLERAATAVSEPTALSILALGLFGLFSRKRLAKKA